MPGRTDHEKGAAQVDIKHRIELFRCHVGKQLVPPHPSIVDHCVNRAECIQRGCHNRLPALGRCHSIVRGDSHAALGLDRPHHSFGGAAFRAADPANIVDHHLRAPACQIERIGPAEALACSGDYGDLAVKGNRHGSALRCAGPNGRAEYP